jgi:hypothetical protein
VPPFPVAWAGANPAQEVLAALRPSLLTSGGPLVAISSPYSRTGPLWNAYSRHFAKDGDLILVVQAPTLALNPTIDPAQIEERRQEDPAAASAEYDAEFRSDRESYVDREVVERLVVPGRRELLPVPGVRYTAFADPSGGKVDSFTLCIAHRERGDRCIVDVLRERKAPFNPDDVCSEYASLCQRYGVSKLVSDRYAGAWTEESWRRHGMRSEPAPLSKSDLYVSLLPQLNAARVELPDAPALVAQLVALERRTSRGTGRDVVDHPPGGRDDLSNALAGAVHLTIGERQVGYIEYFNISDLAMAGNPERPPGMSQSHYNTWREQLRGRR